MAAEFDVEILRLELSDCLSIMHINADQSPRAIVFEDNSVRRSYRRDVFEVCELIG